MYEHSDEVSDLILGLKVSAQLLLRCQQLYLEGHEILYVLVVHYEWRHNGRLEHHRGI